MFWNKLFSKFHFFVACEEREFLYLPNSLTFILHLIIFPLTFYLFYKLEAILLNLLSICM